MNTAIKLSSAAKPKKISILGSTGSIGKNTVDIIDKSEGKYQVEVLTGNRNVSLLAEQAKKLNAKTVVVADEELYQALKESLSGTKINIAAGEKAVEEAAGIKTDVTIAGIMGAACLKPVLSAIRSGNTIGLANKECLVCAGDLVTGEATKNGAKIIPVDSEHNALFQIFDFANKEAVEKITLTASGGPFFRMNRDEMHEITPEQAVKHPNWAMGAKISIDSATLMNKGLEIIEAYHLFPLNKNQIDVLIHPESIIHSLISYVDGSVTAGMSVPDMRIPISYAMSYPERSLNINRRLDLSKIGQLNFFKPDEHKFPSLKVAKQALNAGGTATTILNAANEIAVTSFLMGKISFLEILEIVEKTLNKVEYGNTTDIDEIFEADKQARNIARNFSTGKIPILA